MGMRVLIERHYEKKTYMIDCYWCGSTLEYDENDINTGKRNEKYVICPVCRSFNRHEEYNIVKPEERCSE